MPHMTLAAALEAYEKDGRSKKGVLLTQDGGYFLYGNRICSMRDFEITLKSKYIEIQGKDVPSVLFFGIAENELMWSAAENAHIIPHYLSIIFHIQIEVPDRLIHGILFARQDEAYLSMFTDPETENLYRAVVAYVPNEPLIVPIGDDLKLFAQEHDRDKLKILTSLYRNSETLKHMRDRQGKKDEKENI